MRYCVTRKTSGLIYRWLMLNGWPSGATMRRCRAVIVSYRLGVQAGVGAGQEVKGRWGRGVVQS